MARQADVVRRLVIAVGTGLGIGRRVQNDAAVGVGYRLGKRKDVQEVVRAVC
jgi:hypothetical protein